MKSPALAAVAESRGIDAVSDHGDPPLVVSLVHEPSLQCRGVDDDPTGEAAHGALDTPLHRRDVGARIPDGCDDDRHAPEPCGWDGEDVGVEAVRVHDLDAMRADVASESE